MDDQQISDYLISNLKPWEDSVFGTTYRAAGRLRDGQYLPCIMFGNPKAYLSLAEKRLFDKELRRDEYQFEQVLRTFLVGRSQVNVSDVASVEPSLNAWSEEIIGEIRGETTMGFTFFTAVMKDKKVFSFATSYHFNFFDMPDGYGPCDIAEIHSGMIVAQDGEEKPFSYEEAQKITLYREKPFFYCFNNFLPSN
ncbi:hypothetical protein KA183_20815 [bacterium]|nr:hypothetical protein [bacterium]